MIAVDLSKIKRCRVPRGQQHNGSWEYWNDRCKTIGRKFLGGYGVSPYFITDYDNPPGRCLLDFTVPQVKMEVASSVDCEERCYEEQEYGDLDDDEESMKNCISECEEEIDTWVKGSVKVNVRTTAVEESSLPLVGWHLIDERDDAISAAKVEEYLKPYQELGCGEGDFGWHHIHDFRGNPDEYRTPDVVFLHVKATSPGRCKVRQVIDTYANQMGGQFHPETFESWLARIKRKEATISPQGFTLLSKDRDYQDIMAALEDKLRYGRTKADPRAFREYYLEENVHEVGKWDTWKVPDSDRYTKFNPEYLEETIDFWKDPDNISKVKILLGKIENQVKGRTRYGLRAGVATEPGHVLAWSNAAERWVLFQQRYQPGEDVYLDANYIFVPGTYEILDRVKWLLPDLPLFHMDWTKTMDLSLKEKKERERFR